MSNLSEINAAILVGGLGTRLQPVLKGKPKALVKIRKHPFLEYILQQLDQAGFKKTILCTGHLGEEIKKVFGNRYGNLYLYYSHEKKTLDTAGALRKALSLFDSDIVLVMNGDSFCRIDFKKFWQFHLNKKSSASLVLSPVFDTSDYGKVQLKKDQSIVGFEEKKVENGKGFANAGIYLINKSFISEIPRNKKVSLEKEIFPSWIGKEFYGYQGNNFIDIGTPKNYAQAKSFFKRFVLLDRDETIRFF